MIELNGDDYILYIKGLDNEKLLYELVKQTVIFNSLAQQEMKQNRIHLHENMY